MLEESWWSESAPGCFCIRFSPDLALIDRADDEVTAFLEQHGFAEAFAVRLLLREALLNAVTHGCRRLPGDRVEAQLRIDESEVVLAVEDHGEGFDWRTRASSPDELRAGGRGIDLMKSYAASVEFNECGNQVTLRFPRTREESQLQEQDPAEGVSPA